MEVKKSQKADLEGKKGVFFEIGLTLALAILLFAFEWKSSSEEVSQFQTVAEEQIEEEIIPITQQMLKPPPPPPPAPKLTDLIDIVEDDTQIDEELEIQDVDDTSENTDAQPMQWNLENMEMKILEIQRSLLSLRICRCSPVVMFKNGLPRM